MTFANSCVIAAALLPALTVGLAKFTTLSGRGRYNNNDPRGWESKLEGWKARAVSAQNNGFEAVPLFAFAVLAAQQAGLEQGRTDMLALAFIVCRLVYIGTYLADLASLRTLVWTAATACAIAIVAPALSLAF